MSQDIKRFLPSFLLLCSSYLLAQDQAPTVANAVDDFTVLEDASNSTIDYSNVFTDADNEDSEITKAVQSNTNTDLVTASIDGNTLTLDYVENQNGTATITVRGTSNNKTVDDAFVVTVTALNDAPILDNIPAPPSTIVVGTEYEFLVNPSQADVDDNQFTYSIITDPGFGNPTIEATQNNEFAQFLWYPTGDVIAEDYTFTIRVEDMNSENGTNGTQSDTYSWSVDVVAPGQL